MRRQLAERARGAVWGHRSTQVRQSKWLRRPAIAAYRGLARVALSGPEPKVFANSIPKAGTHVLTSLLGGVSQMWTSGLHVIDKDFREALHEPSDGLGQLDLAAFSARMRTVRNGQFVTAHVGALDGVADELERQGFRSILMIRDPRDVVVSMAFYFARNKRLHLHEEFAAMSDAERFATVISGRPGSTGRPSIPSMSERLRKYQPWLDDPRTLVVRFEDLVGPAGGGSAESQLASVKAVLQHCLRYEDEAQVEQVARDTFATHSATFRKGTVGDWTNHLGGAELALLDEAASGQIAAFGY